MKKIIVSTTIYPISEAIRRYEAFEDWEMVIAGDKKTPPDYASGLKRAVYLTPEMQADYDKELSDAIGWNCVPRRNFGLLWAYDQGADIIAIVDDDNIPNKSWGKNLMLGKPVEANYYETDLPAFDPIGATNHPQVWHRGYPIQLVGLRDYQRKTKRIVTADIQADFWDGNPDTDAICRILYRPECRFDSTCFPFMGSKVSPFNCQNTFLLRSVLKDYFVLPYVGRQDDIWAAYYVLSKGHKVIYGPSTVYHERSPHDLTEDMKQEYLGYEKNLDLVRDLALDPERIFDYLPEKAARAFRLYRRHFQEERTAVPASLLQDGWG